MLKKINLNRSLEAVHVLSEFGKRKRENNVIDDIKNLRLRKEIGKSRTKNVRNLFRWKKKIKESKENNWRY